MKKKLLNAWPIVASALLFQAAFPPLNLGLLVFVALVPWFISLMSPGARGFRSGYLLGFIIVLFQMAFTRDLAYMVTKSIPLAIVPWIVCAFLGGFYFGALGAIFQRALARGWWWAVPLVWGGMEIFRSYIPGLAFPYFFIATPLWPYPVLIQHAYVGTIYLVGAWVVLINLLVVMFMQKVPMRTARPYAIAMLFFLVGSLIRFLTPIQGTSTTIVAGQPAVDLAFGDLDSRDQRLYGNVAYLYARAKEVNAALLVLPEGLAQGGISLPPRTPFTVEPSQPVMFGARRYVMRGAIPGAKESDTKIYQSAFAFDGKQWTYADKARLVVFGEYVPGRKFLPFLDAFKLPSGDLTPSDKTQSVTVNGMKVGPMICFEGLFWDVGQKQVENGAQLLAIMSNDDWYMGTSAPDQLRTSAVWRAIEADLPLVRAASRGYTMAVDQRGRVLREIPLDKPGALAVSLQIPESPTSMPTRPLIVWLLGLSLPILGVGVFLKKKP